MNDVRTLHDQAMTLAQRAVVARHTGDFDAATQLARKALDYEAQAASQIPEGESSEPTRSILYRSAASLACQAGEHRVALQLAAKGLSGYPPPSVEQELLEVYDQARFESELAAGRMTLEEEEMALTLKGRAVGHGMVLYDEFISRLQNLNNLINRTVQRKMSRDYQRSGRIADKYRPFTQFLTAPRAGSFAITFRLGRADGQMPLFIKASEVIDEVLTGIQLVSESKEKQLGTLIGDPAYYRNFLSLTRDMAPDGDKISFVGVAGARKSVSLVKPRSEIQVAPEDEAREEARSQRIVVEGELDYAVSREARELIGLTSREGQEYTIVIQEGLDDLVRSYWGQRVRVVGLYDATKRRITPFDIQAAED